MQQTALLVICFILLMLEPAAMWALKDTTSRMAFTAWVGAVRPSLITLASRPHGLAKTEEGEEMVMEMVPGVADGAAMASMPPAIAVGEVLVVQDGALMTPKLMKCL